MMFTHFAYEQVKCFNSEHIRLSKNIAGFDVAMSKLSCSTAIAKTLSFCNCSSLRAPSPSGTSQTRSSQSVFSFCKGYLVGQFMTDKEHFLLFFSALMYSP